MQRSKNLSVSRARKALAGFALFCSVIVPFGISSAYAADAVAAGAGSQATLNVGDTYGGGKVAYIFRKSDRGYVAGQVHGLIAAGEDIAPASWAKAVKSCTEYRGGGHDDWRLPSKDELDRFYENRFAIGGFKERHYYWSSTESDRNDAWDLSFRTGNHNLGYKLEYNNVRPVRTF
ncbi:MAG: DUF1566 domain-containing protein [Chlorobiaceae bacterium]|nr:DUF1566 domain-containing protein [Chlorobiaceae bacterium]